MIYDRVFVIMWSNYNQIMLYLLQLLKRRCLHVFREFDWKILWEQAKETGVVCFISKAVQLTFTSFHCRIHIATKRIQSPAAGRISHPPSQSAPCFPSTLGRWSRELCFHPLYTCRQFHLHMDAWTLPMLQWKENARGLLAQNIKSLWPQSGFSLLSDASSINLGSGSTILRLMTLLNHNVGCFNNDDSGSWD